ncbi:unnamed protein product [Linum tenue]|uniref:Formin-like protein n=1 Tax=Linum tenue TaxID=586396 RepID=A0AAV0L198_9ROSI|nr:unnamed protein product [Linum tenue]
MEFSFQEGGFATLDRTLGMDSIVLRGGDCRPMLGAMGQDPFIDDDDGAPQILLGTPRRNQNCNQADVEINCNVFHPQIGERRAMMGIMFKVIMFHTRSIRPNVLIFSKEQAEALWNSKLECPKNFKVLVSEMEYAAPTGSLVLEEKECLPWEASDVVDPLTGKNARLLKDLKDKVEDHESIDLKKQSVPPALSSKPSRDAKSEEPCLETSSIEHGGGMCVSSIKVPAPSKNICSPRIPQTPVSMRYPNVSAYLGLGITALLHDHASSTATDESAHLSPAAIAVSSHVRNVRKPVHLSATFDVKLLPQPSSQSHHDSTNNGTSSEAKKSPIPPPPPLPQLPLARNSPVRTVKAKPTNKAATCNDPPLPPPLPPLLAKQVKSPPSKRQPDPPSPPPPPPSTLPKVTLPPPPVPPAKGILTNRNVPLVPGPPRAGLMPRSRIQAQPRRSSLKPYHWLKLTRATQGSIWAEAQKYPHDTSLAPEFDISELESLFSAAATPSSEMKGIGAKSKRRVRKSEKVQLIELRRAYNCEIMLTKVKIPLHDLMSSILALDDSVLDVDQVDSLVKFCPTKEEMELLKGYKGDKESLGKCEMFFLELMKVPRVESKLRVFSFKMQFSQQVSDLKRNLNVVNSAAEEASFLLLTFCYVFFIVFSSPNFFQLTKHHEQYVITQIRSSVKLKRIMQSVLSLGNAVNQGTARGSAVGFRLDSLLKLTDTRSRDNKMTLMHYLCKIQLKYLAEEMQAISKGLEKVLQELAASEKNDGEVSEYFCKIMRAFLSCAEREVKSLSSLYSSVGRNVDALAVYFGEDPARCPFEQVVSTLMNFEKIFARAHQENIKRVELERRKAEKEAEKQRSNTINGDSRREPAVDFLQSIRSRYIR